MKTHIKSLRDLIIAVIDVFYPLFSKLMDLQTFRYAACGGANTLLGICIYFTSYHFILYKKIVYTPVVAISPYIAAFLIEFLVIFPLGFFLMKYVVYQESTIRSRVQLARYFAQVLMCLLLNYICLKIFVEYFHIYPTVAKLFTTVIVIFISYLTQKHFTFRVGKSGRLEAETD
jgi:putative flippase GtrA